MATAAPTPAQKSPQLPAAVQLGTPPPPPPPSSPPAPSDPYVTTKANLRDTIKWLAATFSALAAVVIAGTPLSGLGKLEFGLTWAIAFLFLVGAFVCICIALAITISLLRGDFLYFSDILATATATSGPPKLSAWARLKRLWRALIHGQDMAEMDEADRASIPLLCANLNAHPGDVLSFEYPTIESLAKEAEYRKNKLDVARAAWKAQPSQATSDALDDAEDALGELGPDLQRVQFFGMAFLFYARTRRAMRTLFLLGVAALLLLVLFTTLVQQPDKDSKPKTSSVVNNFPPAISASAPVDIEVLPTLAPVLFRTGDASLDSENLKRIDAARAALRTHPRASLLLYAHTDTVAGDSLNENLAHNRGTVVRRALIREGGLDAGRILVSEQPKSGLPELTGSSTESQTNRSVVMQLVNLP
jgi:hypothetical protein